MEANIVWGEVVVRNRWVPGSGWIGDWNGNFGWGVGITRSRRAIWMWGGEEIWELGVELVRWFERLTWRYRRRLCQGRRRVWMFWKGLWPKESDTFLIYLQVSCSGVEGLKWWQIRNSCWHPQGNIIQIILLQKEHCDNWQYHKHQGYKNNLWLEVPSWEFFWIGANWAGISVIYSMLNWFSIS